MTGALCLMFGIWLLLSGPSLAVAEMSFQLVTESERSFSRPHDLTLSPDARYLYVADLGNDAVKVLDPHTLAIVGVIGKGELSSPHDVTFDKDGHLLVADTGNDRIAIYKVRGVQAEYVGEMSEGLGSPEGVTQAQDGRVYVTNAGLHNIVVFSGRDKLLSVGSYGSAEAQYVRPHDIEVDSTGRICVADPGNNRVQILDLSLRVVKAMGGPSYAFHEPKYLALDEKGWLYVADQYNNKVKVFDSQYRLVGVIPTGDQSKGRNQLNKPEGVEVLREFLWISDTYNDRILLFKRQGDSGRS